MHHQGGQADRSGGSARFSNACARSEPRAWVCAMPKILESPSNLPVCGRRHSVGCQVDGLWSTRLPTLGEGQSLPLQRPSPAQVQPNALSSVRDVPSLNSLRSRLRYSNARSGWTTCSINAPSSASAARWPGEPSSTARYTLLLPQPARRFPHPGDRDSALIAIERAGAHRRPRDAR